MYALRVDRVEPSALPPAGVKSRHDSYNEDYRWINAASGTGPSLQRSKSLRNHHSASYHPPEKLELPAGKPGPRNKPDHYFIDDIPYAGPSPHVGLTLIQPLRLSAGDHVQQQQQPSSSTLPEIPSPIRITNPLNPQYTWGVEKDTNCRLPYPTATREPGEWRCTSPVRTGALDITDIEGSKPSTKIRSRKDEYSSFDYSDVTSRSSSPVKQRLRETIRLGREAVLVPIDTPRLGIWAGSLGGDSGSFLHTHREPTNPNSPVYKVHGHVITDGVNVGRPKQLIKPGLENVHRSWPHVGNLNSVVSHWDNLEAKNTWPGSPTRRYAAAVKAGKARIEAAVAEVSALPS
ncbi:hypothetical protein CEUSTIGMA_g8241.t1 [Chlamydomonas eustigma]|uniref:Uncharacterized protein n=1 Tax=Chlamydomonas eustigma TaxID=1157962 RepID=A0A250XCJ1_9CHLO|nr:hypothetical protein CEUSTIGMA_g8241.t1 [Chlamydomonas eustigma]|eukprot:GAX80805.1 hypothetical protein CEUSTIGMA_g8241.t1 [Chlamydomonas eustigma]